MVADELFGQTIQVEPGNAWFYFSSQHPKSAGDQQGRFPSSIQSPLQS